MLSFPMFLVALVLGAGLYWVISRKSKGKYAKEGKKLREKLLKKIMKKIEE